MEARGIVPKSSTQNVSKVSKGGVAASGSTSSADKSPPTPDQSSNKSVQTTTKNQNTGYEDPQLGGISSED